MHETSLWIFSNIYMCITIDNYFLERKYFLHNVYSMILSQLTDLGHSTNLIYLFFFQQYLVIIYSGPGHHDKFWGYSYEKSKSPT